MVGAFAVCTVTLVPAGLWCAGVESPIRPRPIMLPPSLATIKESEQLTVTTVEVSTNIKGGTLDYQGVWLLRGTVLLGVDLSQVRYINADQETRHAVISLPPIHVVMSKVSHAGGSQEVKLEKVPLIALSDPQPIRDEVWKFGERKVLRLGQEPGHIERAKVQAERVLEKLFKGVGWTVAFEWREPTAKATEAADQKATPLPSS
jgi:hypothetical protein